jgi:hypothetical protein
MAGRSLSQCDAYGGIADKHHAERMGLSCNDPKRFGV